MSKKIVLILLTVLALSISACTRAASVAAITPSPKANFPKAAATTGMSSVAMAGTQTAVANSGLPMPTSAGTEVGTPVESANPTFTPLAGANLTTEPVLPTAQPINTALPTPTTSVLPTASLNTPMPYPTSGPITVPTTYVLHAGEFPYCLARRFNVNPSELLSLNGLSSGQTNFAPGTTLSIPQSGNVFPSERALKTHPAQYTVVSGDTIYSIACDFGDVDPMGIVQANSLSGTYDLTVGTTIQIP